MSANRQSANNGVIIITIIFYQIKPVDIIFLSVGENKMGIQSFVQLLALFIAFI